MSGATVDQALSAFAIGDATSAAVVTACLASLEAEGIVVALVTNEGEVNVGERGRAATELFARLAAETRPHRCYGTAREARWSWIGDGARWFACEPAADRGTVVIVGESDDARDDVLPRLPKAARACAAALARDATLGDARETRHALKNLVAAVLGNAEVALEAGDDATRRRALRHLVDAAQRLDEAITRRL